MQRFKSSDGVMIAYYIWGKANDKPMVVLHHGFAASAITNWEAPGIVTKLTAAGRRVLAPDARGHGESDKPHDSRFYGEERMARDLFELLDLLEVPRADLVGYSMGAIVSLIAATSKRRSRFGRTIPRRTTTSPMPTWSSASSMRRCGTSSARSSWRRSRFRSTTTWRGRW